VGSANDGLVMEDQPLLRQGRFELADGRALSDRRWCRAAALASSPR
jgi:hypothetical protein